MCNYLEQLDMSVIKGSVDYGLIESSPRASVVIVAYNTDESVFLECLGSLQKQTVRDFEIVVVDNSNRADVRDLASRYTLKYVKLNKNYGLTVARNVGIKFAKADIVIFLDDDAIAAGDFVAEHIRAYEKHKILGLRGKSLPRTSNVFNYLNSYGDLGEEKIGCYINLEGNSSFRKDVLVEVGGFNSELKKAGGGEGLELTYRIIQRYGDKDKVIYYPKAIIYHDYYGSFSKYARKRLRHREYKDMLRRQLPDIFEFEKSYGLRPNKKALAALSLVNRVKLQAVRGLLTLIVVARSLIRKCFGR